MPAAAVHVVCFGNSWHGDDGFGSRVFHHLRELGALPRGVELFDAGIAGLNALPYFEDCAKAVMVDALSVGGPAGSVHRMLPNDLAPRGASSACTSWACPSCWPRSGRPRARRPSSS